ncbi:hypothetical protein DJ013_02180 [Arcticibacterium luteifluviistationis]|uniref:Alpha/beta hydrolase n=1 Tax=Arcticibacterium luteifluviistationis TaxID=1784714 RepID=A0A2Z4G7B7_9BACT|nr:hypothetical protein DJ013_02180 [Arcticibacterium luteifluviistationis]
MFSCDSAPEPIAEIIERGEIIEDWTYEFFLEGRDQNAFRLWVPENTRVKGILVLAPGGAGNGTILANSDAWQEYAKQEKLALLGVHVNSPLGSAASNLLFALDQITKARNLAYISSLPFLLRGYSHGGRFSQEFASIYPDKTIAYANIKGTIIQTGTKLPPSLLISGSNDTPGRNKAITQVFLAQRKLKTITCFAEEPNIGHELGNSDVLVKAFFSSILKERLKNSELITLKETDYLLGNNSNLQYSAYNLFPESIEEASCLFDEEFASIWQSFAE